MENPKKNLFGDNDFSIMMKTAVAILLLLSINFSGKAQNGLTAWQPNINKYTVLDSAYMKCTYKLTYVTDTLSKNYSTPHSLDH